MPRMPGLKPSEERRERPLSWPVHTLLVPILRFEDHNAISGISTERPIDCSCAKSSLNLRCISVIVISFMEEGEVIIFPLKPLNYQQSVLSCPLLYQ